MDLDESLASVAAYGAPEALDRLKEHLDPSWIEEALTWSGTTSIRRRRLPADQVVWLVIGMALYRNEPIEHIVDMLDLALPDKKDTLVAKSAIAQARRRLTEEPLAYLFATTAAEWAKRSADARKWRGLSLYGLDGTTIRVPDSRENRATFGGSYAGATRGESGYRNVRESDASGRARTRMEVEPTEADVVRRIFRERVEGRGFKQIAIRLNNDGLKSPRAGRRGTGTWSPGCVYELLHRERYRGVYIHGEYDRPRKGGRRPTVAASPESILRVEKPEWRIIDDETWFAVQAMRNARIAGRAPGPRCKYPLTGLVRCGHCGASVGVVSKRVGTTNVQAYACSYHHYRGSAACAVSVRQPRTEVEGHLVDYVREKVLGPAVEDQIVARVQAEVERRLEGPSIDTRGLEAELAKLEREKSNLVSAIAAGGDVDELVEAVKARKAAIAGIQSRLAASKAAPEALRRTREVCEPYVRARLAELRELIVQPSEDARRGWRALFPEGLVFQPVRVGRRHIWRAQATAQIGGGPGPATYTLESDPSGIRTRIRTEPSRRLAQ